ncbi:MAG: helix-turn-helix transcriptional regulator [Ignavibacteria bacterium]|nr:helix-turn-helix transcriptional regulator [Ignavibacteria bacterium]
MKNRKTKIRTFEQHIEKEYGKKGSSKRDKFESEYESFKLGVMIQELRKSKKITQEQLAKKCGTTKNYISRIENDASDIRLSTLIRIIQKGFNGILKLSVVNNERKKENDFLDKLSGIQKKEINSAFKKSQVAEKLINYSSD